MDKIYDSETGCCQRFDPKPWDEKEVTWKNKLFLRDHVISFFHIPLNMGGVMKRDVEKIAAAGALPEKAVMLMDEGSLWGSDIFIEVAKEVPGAKMERISGTFLTKVFEGPYQDAGKWAKEMQEFVKSKGKETKKLYFYYTTCPSCAKFYGKNYTVLVARV
ncbi:MAG: hypothetical protein PHF51_03205 [Candidatus ainarchaeum sp.]|nr:hypothetical protein [Candidatus ainarchaeum sp.]